MQKSNIRGHITIWNEKREKWYFEDTGKDVSYEVTCKKCNLPCDIDGPDPCLGLLPGVEFACCGHGNRANSYIKFDNGLIIRGFKLANNA